MRSKIIYLAGVIAILICSACSPEKVTQYAATEKYPDEQVTTSATVKKAMIVIAHDDDMCGMSGTISKLDRAGWEIRCLSFLNEDSLRNQAHIRACKHLLDTVIFLPFRGADYRNDLDTNKVAYRAIPKERFGEVFNRDLVEPKLVEAINAFEPTIIFSLDNEIGGYGHPDHVFISQMVLDLANQKTIKPDYIFQSVYTDHMEESIIGKRLSEKMKSWGFAGDGWEFAKKTYKVDGMPEPNVQVDIRAEAVPKMNYLRSYNKRERQVIGFYIPAFEEYKAEKYFEIFDREFFRVIKF